MLRFAKTHPHHHQDHAQVATVPEEPCAPATHATPKSILKRTNNITSKPATEPPPPPPRPKTVANKNRNMNNNNIRFFDQAQLFLIPHVDDYTEDEKQNYWFEANEYAQIKENNKMLLDIIQSGPYSIEYYENHDVYCLRGLESKAASLSNSPGHRLGRKRSSSRRRINRSGAAAAVFAEQHRQHQERQQQQQQQRSDCESEESGSKVSDWDRIRDAYVDVTARCHDEAHTQGLRDAEKASQYLSSQ